MKIAFIGLGNMGGPMALNLHKAGHAVSAFDLSADACRKWEADGLPIARSAVDTVQGAEVVISMLPASQHVEALYLGGDGKAGLMEQIAKGTLVIDSSTMAIGRPKYNCTNRRPVAYAWPVVPIIVTALSCVAITVSPTAHHGSDRFASR